MPGIEMVWAIMVPGSAGIFPANNVSKGNRKKTAIARYRVLSFMPEILDENRDFFNRVFMSLMG
jgi:hypothetical protein